jgi:nitrogen fixation/metabolism regulation signal transduction histidine kinase
MLCQDIIPRGMECYIYLLTDLPQIKGHSVILPSVSERPAAIVHWALHLTGKRHAMKMPTKTVTIIISFFILLIVTYIDIITAADLVLGVFYFIPISITAWYCGRNQAIALSLIGALLWLFADHMTGRPYNHYYYAYLNMVLRWLSFIIIAFAFSQITIMLNKEKLLRRELSDALDKIKLFAESAKKIAEGDLSVEVPLLTKGGNDSVNETFNYMVKSLAQQKKIEEKLNRLEHQAVMAETASYLAHEIRNPLNLIMLTAHHLGNQFAPHEMEKSQKFQELISSLKAETEQLNKVVNNFLTIGKPAELRREPCTVEDILADIVLMVRQQLLSKAISIERSGDMKRVFIADREQLRLVFLNLIVNAITAVRSGGKIQIDAAFNEELKQVHISVIDNGPGISENDFDKIFEPYFTRKDGGTGLGLALVKRIIKDHDGDVVVENRTEGGADFKIWLPLNT